MSVPTQARAEADPAAPAKAGRRTLGLMLLLTVLGAVLVLTAVGRVWAEGVAGTLKVSVTGGRISELPGGLALVALAAAVAVFAVRGAGRVAVGALTLLAGLGAAAAAAAGAGDTAALDGEAARKLALSGTTAAGITHTAWPWVALLGGLLLALAGLLTTWYGRGWPAMGSRYEAPTRKAPAKAAESPADLWKALDRGEDPTAL
ncbi:TIGR02234 family membrane protein [Streptomyces sp. CB01881]|uniref:TIGR02234 family membrane protein n=1 Tax=Streptomyces sp. CB01881 TaxID=2078691 RepID=UPI000CDCB44D|nr:TIGR02234 family membrane protein [Streptomyces sp. CB01881]AUY52180.1 TIGR02234 family membrane protein [Streptomyces sp. CB01881]TYC71607.1 TIGR02234 family membrane protein [Streptomyces sp. CB01881]